MEGKMLWFNAKKGFGVICTESDERLHVDETGFEPGTIPTGRCAGRRVAFEVVEGDEPAAVNVTFPDADAPRRARTRHGGRVRA
jgi:cold shock CspA family protein